MAGSAPPPGFELDAHPSALPDGFEVDAPRAKAPKAKPGFLDSVAAGLNEVVGNTAGTIDRGLRAVGVDLDPLNKRLGLPTAQQERDTSNAAADNAGTGGRIVGNIVGTIPTALVRGGSAVAGGLSGLATSRETSAAGLAKDAGIGAASGAIGSGVVGGIARAISPRVAPIVQRLLDQGVSLTPGQILGAGNSYVGKVAKSMEDRLTGFPIVGDAIQGARDRGNATFNAAAINRALKPIGDKLDRGLQSGRDAIAQAGDKLSAAYDDVLPRLTAQADTKFGTDLSSIAQDASALHPERAKQFGAIVQNDVARQFNSGTLDGDGLKAIETKLGQRIRDASGSTDTDQRELGRMLERVQASVRDLAARQNPAEAARLSSINEGWANLTRVERAGAAGRDGVFTPGQLATAVRQSDSSVRKRGVARGTALMQDLVDDSRAVLPSGVGDSGTAGRGTIGLLAGGVLGLPAVAGAAGAALPYTRVGQRVATAALTGRQGAGFSAAGNFVDRLRAPASISAPTLLRRVND